MRPNSGSTVNAILCSQSECFFYTFSLRFFFIILVLSIFSFCSKQRFSDPNDWEKNRIIKKAEETPELQRLLKLYGKLSYKQMVLCCQAALSILNLYEQKSLSKVAP